jgi:hypothetical protein
MNENEGWSIIALEDDDSKRIYRMMMTLPVGLDITPFTENISVEWPFAEEGLPEADDSERLRAFESFLSALDDTSGNSFLTFVFTGDGKREWSYYAKDYDTFLEELNVALEDKPRFPIDIMHSHDPEWEYWNGVKASIVTSED